MKSSLNKSLALLLCLVMCLSLFPAAAFAEQITTRIEPSCTEAGQILTEDPQTHTVRAETIPPTGHSFGEWTPADGGYEERICSVCGASEHRVMMTAAEEQFPRLDLRGSMEGINKKARVTLEADFTGAGEDFQCYAVMTMQGHSTLGLDKQNYTLRFYDDQDAQEKHKLRFGDWKKEHKFILKADYLDVTQGRNLICAQLWRAVEETRENLPPQIAALPTLGTVDGFPVSVWLNDSFLGLYTLCLHKDDDLYGMHDGEQSAILICNRSVEDEAFFRAPVELDAEGVHDWEIEFSGTEDWDWARESFNSLIDFVMRSSDEEFRERLRDYLDVDAAIDYLVFICTLGLVNSGAKDLVMLSYGGAWIPTAFDMDEAFGMMPGGEGFYPPDSFLPQREDGVWTSGTGSLLWDRLLQNFDEEIRTRYQTLRQGVLSEENILSAVDAYIGGIPASLYLREAERYPGRPAASEMKEQIQNYLIERLPILDEKLGGTES